MHGPHLLSVLRSVNSARLQIIIVRDSLNGSQSPCNAPESVVINSLCHSFHASSLSSYQFDMNSPFSGLYRAASAFSRSSRLLRNTPRSSPIPDSVCAKCRRQQIRFNSGRQLADDPQWVSPIDQPAQIVRVGKRHGPGLIILGTHLAKLPQIIRPTFVRLSQYSG